MAQYDISGGVRRQAQTG